MGLSNFIFGAESNSSNNAGISRTQLDEQFKELAEIEGLTEQKLTLRAKAYYLTMRQYKNKGCRIITMGENIHRSVGINIESFEKPQIQNSPRRTQKLKFLILQLQRRLKSSEMGGYSKSSIIKVE